MKKASHARARVADHLDQGGVRLSGADRQRLVGYQQRAQPGSIVARDPGAELERRTPVGARVDRREHALEWAVGALDESAYIDRQVFGFDEYFVHDTPERIAAGGRAMVAEQNPRDLRRAGGGDDVHRAGV